MTKLNMKMILLVTCVIALVTTTGCLVPAGGQPGYGHRYGHRGYHGRSEVIVRSRSEVVAPRPVIVVPAPVIVVPVPSVRVRVD
jgi:hypothetical protein